jgi:hypothetical protein
MKQKQVHIEEAMTTNREAQITAEQSRAVMVFTGKFVLYHNLGSIMAPNP